MQNFMTTKPVKSTKKTNLKTNTTKITAGVGMTATVVAAVGAYFLYGSKQAKRNRQTIKSWALKAKAEVLERMEQTKAISKVEYEELINTVASAYNDAHKVTKGELKNFTTEMNGHWQAIEKITRPKRPVGKEVTKKVAKKISKQVSKKSTT